MVNLNNEKLYPTLLGALGVISGVILKNSMEQLGTPDNVLGKIVGPILFMVGWAQVVYALGFEPATGTLPMNQNTLMLALSAISIMVAVFMMKKLMVEGQPMQMIYPAMFAGGWGLLAYVAGNNPWTWSAALLVLASMMGVLPWQRTNGVVDGPGLPMFVIAWLLLAVNNSLVSL